MSNSVRYREWSKENLYAGFLDSEAVHDGDRFGHDHVVKRRNSEVWGLVQSLLSM